MRGYWLSKLCYDLQNPALAAEYRTHRDTYSILESLLQERIGRADVSIRRFIADVPVGFQLIGRPFAERTLFRIRHAFQQATAWHMSAPLPP